MLKIYDKDHNAIGHLVKYRDLKIESELATGDKTLSFVYLAKHHTLENEMYIRTKDDEYVIKEVPGTTEAFPQIVAALNLEDLQRDMWQTYSATDATITDAVRPVLAGTGWTVGHCDVTKRRNAGMMQLSTLGVIQKLCTAFMCEPVFDTINKQVSFYSRRGSDRGVYFMRGLNLKKLQKRRTSYNFYTRVIPIGQSGLSIADVNDGKNYLENYQYSKKILTYIWKDESYTDPQALKEDAELLLEDLSKPEVSYQADVYDLAKQKPEYDALSYGLGDTITLIDYDTNTREQQRIKKITEYPQTPEKNTCELANTTLTFEEMQQKYQEAAEIINMTVAGDGRYTGTISVSDILKFEEGIAGSTTIGGINGSISTMQGDIALVKGKFGEVETNYLKADDAELKYATIERAEIIEANIHSLQGDYGEFKTLATQEFSAQKALIDEVSGKFASFKTGEFEDLKAKQAELETAIIGKAEITDLDAIRTRTQQLETDVAGINTLINGNLTSDNIHNLTLTSKNTTIENGMIKNAMIDSLAFNKITGIDINTTKMTVHSDDGKSTWSDNTIQISDANRVRVQIGKDASGDYTLAVWDKTGKLIWDALGATENTIQRKIIRNAVVADDAAIAGSKLDIPSVIREVNGAQTKISSTAINVDKAGQTLDMVLNSMETTIGDNLDAAKLYADGQLTAAQQYALNQANSALASAKSYADAIEIGGRNLIAESKEKRTTRTTTNNWIEERGWAINNTAYGFQQIQKGGQFTLSFDYEIKNITTAANMHIALRSEVSKYTQNMQPKIPLTVGDNAGHYETTFEPNAGAKQYGTGWLLSGFGEGKNAGAIIILRNIKLEKGNRATDWSPAPEDTEAEISNLTEITTTHTTSISTMQGQISALIAEDTSIKGNYNALVSRYNATVAEVDKVKTTIGEHTTLLDAQGEDILAVQTKANTIESDLSGTKQTVSAVQSDLSGTKSRVTTVETGLDGIKTRVSAAETALSKKADSSAVSTLTSRVATCETTLDGFETSLTATNKTVSDNYTSLKNYTDSAKSAAISAAATDATTKANNALASARGYADGILDELEIGGTNLLKSTNVEYNTARVWALFGDNGRAARNNISISDAPNKGVIYGVSIAPTDTAYTYAAIFQHVAMYAGKSYTVSCYARGSGTLNLRFAYLKAAGGNSTYKTKFYTLSANWARYAYTLLTDIDLSGVAFGVNTGGSIEMCGFKLETGNRATDWSPAPEDFYAEIDLTNATVATHTEQISTHDARITANENAIKLKVSTQDFNSYKTTVTGAISTAKTEAINTAASDATTKANNAKSAAISTAASDAKTKADKALTDAKTYTNAQITTVNQSLSTTNQEISVLKGQIALKVEQTDIDMAVSNIQIGGTNLIPGTRDMSSYGKSSNVTLSTDAEGFAVASFAAVSTLAWNSINSRPPIPLSVVRGKQVTLSFWVRSDDYATINADTSHGLFITLAICTASSNSRTLYGGGSKFTYTLSSSWKKFSATYTLADSFFKNGSGTISSTDRFYVQVYNYSLYRMQVKKIKLEIGTKATDWSPAPEDTDAAIEAVDARFASYSTTTQMQSAINLAKTSITQSVSETYATKSQVSTVSGNVTSLTTRMSAAESKLTKDSLVTTIGTYYATQTYAENVNATATAALNRPDKSNLITISPSRLLNNEFTHLSSGGADNNGVPCVKGAVSDKYLMFCDYTENIFNVGDTVYFEGTVPNWGSSDITATLRIWFYDSNKKHLWSQGGTKFTLKKTSWNKCTGQVSVTANSYMANVKYFLIGLDKSSTSVPIGLTTGSYAEKIGSYAQTIATQTANKFNWLVKSGTGATDFTLTDRTATLIANAINLKGLVTFSGLDSAAQSKITTAQSTADTAKSNAATAQSTANTAKTNAATAQSTADAAKTAATAAKSWTDANGTNMTNLRNMVLKWTNNAVSTSTCIQGGWIATGTVTANQIAAGAVVAGKIASGAVTTDKLAAGAVTAAKINVTDLFAQDITATGTIRGVKLIGSRFETANASTPNNKMIIEKSVQKIYANAEYDTYAGAIQPMYTKVAMEETINGESIIAENQVPGIQIAANYLFDVKVGKTTAIRITEADGIRLGYRKLRIGNCALEATTDGKALYFTTTTGDSRQVDIGNSLNKGRLVCSAAGNFGLYNAKYEKWLIRCEQNGTIVSNATSSDKRLKANIAPTTVNALSVINQIQMRQFDWIKEGVHQKIGVVADELETIDPYLAVGGGYDADGMNVKCVRDFYLLGYAIKGIQEICEIDRAQNSTLATHEGRINSLQAQLNAALAKVAQQAAEIAQLRVKLQATA